MVTEYLALAGSVGAQDPAAALVAARLRLRLSDWRDNHEELLPIARASTMLPEAQALSIQLRTVAETGLAALDDLESRRRTPAPQAAERAGALRRAGQQHGALQIMVTAPVLRLVEAAAQAAQ